MTAAKLFPKYFSKQAIRTVYNERLAESSVVGTDGVTGKAFAEQLDAQIELIHRKIILGSYKFTRYKEKLVSKGANNFPRPLSIPTIRDRLVLRCLHDFMREIFPEARVKRPHNYIFRIRKTLNSDEEKRSFVRLDIKDFYPSINHKLLVSTIKCRVRKGQIISLIKSAIETTNQKGQTATCGVPQGLSISNLLANLYLIESDKKLEKITGTDRCYRYVDDILAISNSDSANQLFKSIEQLLKKRKLRVHSPDTKKGKSHICKVEDGIDYLGFSITPSKISVRKSSIARMYDNISAVITQGKHSKNIGRMRWKLDLKITGCILKGQRFGWLHFFQQTEDTVQLAQLDAFVDKLLKENIEPDPNYAPKRFLKAYNEIRFRFVDTGYIPNFDRFVREDRVKFLSVMSPRLAKNLDSKSDKEVEDLFFREITRQVSELERDLQEPSS